ncbi:MAG: hypothetical protein O3A00_08120 [Planctomycetota bacterium]|nr:hypothetical protein [Planctomycetota bacterium]
MRTIMFSLALIVAMVLETSLPLAHGPDWFAFVLALILWQWDCASAVVLAAITGFGADCVSSTQFGVQMFWAVIVVSAGLSLKRHEALSLLRTAMATFVITVAWRLGCGTSDSLLSRDFDWQIVAWTSIVAAGWTALLVFVIGLIPQAFLSSTHHQSARRRKSSRLTGLSLDS